MNTAQKQILAAARQIDEQSGGSIRLAYWNGDALSMRWNLYQGGELLVNGWDTLAASAFVKGWMLANLYRQGSIACL